MIVIITTMNIQSDLNFHDKKRPPLGGLIYYQLIPQASKPPSGQA